MCIYHVSRWLCLHTIGSWPGGSSVCAVFFSVHSFILKYHSLTHLFTHLQSPTGPKCPLGVIYQWWVRIAYCLHLLLAHFLRWVKHFCDIAFPFFPRRLSRWRINLWIQQWFFETGSLSFPVTLPPPSFFPWCTPLFSFWPVFYCSTISTGLSLRCW